MTSREVWITGIGLLTCLGDDQASHHEALAAGCDPPRIDATTYAPYAIHPLGQVDYSRQIPKKSDQRQMELWQRIGVYSAGLALTDAGLAHDAEMLSSTHLIVAAGSGERDTAVDTKILESIGESGDTELLAKEVLPTALRPTLFLAQLSNLLAGNISIVHNVTASSRTFMGEEMAGLGALENAYRRIVGGQGDLFLVGGALNAEREDLLLGYELGRNLWTHAYQPVWSRKAKGGGFIPGSVGAFLVVESRAHAEARGRTPYARVRDVVSDRCRRKPGELTETLSRLFAKLGAEPGATAVLSGASGVEPATSDELKFLQGLESSGHQVSVRAYGSRLGHSVEAHFPVGIGLAALALAKREFHAPSPEGGVETPFEGAPSRILVTGVGHWRGEGLAMLERVT